MNMIDNRLIVALLTVCVIPVGCIGSSPPSHDSLDKTSPSLTPVPTPGQPSSLNGSTAATYARQYERYQVYNQILDNETSELEVDCVAEVIKITPTGYYVSAACSAVERIEPDTNATHLGSISERMSLPRMYYINETDIFRITPIRLTTNNVLTGLKEDEALNIPQHIYIYNFDSSSHEYTINITYMDSEGGRNQTTYVQKVDSHTGLKLVRVANQTGNYQVTVRDNDTTKNHSWHVSSRHDTDGVTIISGYRGHLFIKPHPQS